MTHVYSIPFRIASMVLLAVLVTAGIGYFAYSNLHEALFDQKRVELANEIDTMVDLINGYRARAEKGEFSVESAQRQAVEAIRPIRFGADGNYFFVNRLDGTILLMPTRPEMEGSKQLDLRDAKGFDIIRGLIGVAEAGKGELIYEWQKPGETKPSLKLASARKIEGWDWIVGTGFHVTDIEAALTRSSRVLITGTVVAIGAMALIALFVTLSISRPLAGLTRSLRRLVGGDLEAAIEGEGRRDEPGQIADAIVSFRDQLRRRAAEEAEAETRRRGEAERLRREALSGLATEVDGSVRKTAVDLEGAANGFEKAAEALQAMSNDTRRQAETSAQAGRTTQQNVQAVSSAAEELSASIGEIVNQVEHAAELTAGAVAQTSRATEVIHGLDEASAEIGKVVALIEEIAGQTNLLALNATIEAARAGEAGKGFAVVASEVKALAGQTSRATEEISRRIAVIQQATNQAVTATGSVGTSIQEISHISNSIAATLDQQNAAVSEITRAISETLGAVSGLAADMQRLMDNAAVTDGKSTEVATAARHMRGDTELLQSQVDRLMRELRGA